MQSVSQSIVSVERNKETTMTNLDWEPRHFSRDDMLGTIPAHGTDETHTRLSRFSRWRLAIQDAHQAMERDDRSSLEASSYYSFSSPDGSPTEPIASSPMSRPIQPKRRSPPMALTILVTKRDSSATMSDLASPPLPTASFDIDKWPTPPTSAILPTVSPVSSISSSDTKGSSVHSRRVSHITDTAVAISSKEHKWPARSEEMLQELQKGSQWQPSQVAVRFNKQQSSSQQTPRQREQEHEDLMQCRLAQLRSEVEILRHKSSFLEEALERTRHERKAVLAERQAVNHDGDATTARLPRQGPSVLDQSRPSSRSAYTMDPSGLAEGRSETYPSKLPDSGCMQGMPAQRRLRAVQSETRLRKGAPTGIPRPSFSLIPSTALPLRADLSTVRSTEHVAEPASLPPAEVMNRPWPSAVESRTSRSTWRLRKELLARGAPLTKIIDMWRGFGKLGAQ